VSKVLATVLCACLCTSAVAGEFLDTFDYPDGSFPPEYTWTGDPRGGGWFEVHNGEFTHVDGGHVHYFRDGDIVGDGIYSFFVLDSDWDFAWRITSSDPMSGRCLVLYHNDHWGYEAYSLTEFSWWTLGGYPEGQFMWHNGSNLDIVHHTSDPLVGWHEILILDYGTSVEVRVDGFTIFDETVEEIPAGYVGMGCYGPGVMTPAFDFVEYSYHHGSPVESASWSAIKSLFR
jgi:hypothetical protein